MKRSLLSLFVIMLSLYARSQDDMMSILNQNATPEKEFATATFKSTRIMNGHSVQNMAPGQLDLRISHRFGRLNTGAYEFFGLDEANMRIGFEYGITNWLMAGIGRGNYWKTYDGFVKLSALRQSAAKGGSPVSVSLFASASDRTIKLTDPSEIDNFSARMAYTGQLLIARKFSPSVSLQLMPTMISRNIVAASPDNLFALGAGGRVKLSKRVSLNAEYYHRFSSGQITFQNAETYDPLSVGVDIETGGHVFQLILTNSVSMIEKGFIGETTGDWLNGDIRFGFSISRVFNLKK